MSDYKDDDVKKEEANAYDKLSQILAPYPKQLYQAVQDLANARTVADTEVNAALEKVKQSGEEYASIQNRVAELLRRGQSIENALNGGTEALEKWIKRLADQEKKKI